MGAVLTLLGSNATQLSSEEEPCRQISMRSHDGNTEISIGHSDVDPATRYGFIRAGESYTIGPFPPGVGIRPCDVYVAGSVGDALTWSGVIY